jgi:hypothetical protein
MLAVKLLAVPLSLVIRAQGGPGTLGFTDMASYQQIS